MGTLTYTLIPPKRWYDGIYIQLQKNITSYHTAVMRRLMSIVWEWLARCSLGSHVESSIQWIHSMITTRGESWLSLCFNCRLSWNKNKWKPIPNKSVRMLNVISQIKHTAPHPVREWHSTTLARTWKRTEIRLIIMGSCLWVVCASQIWPVHNYEYPTALYNSVQQNVDYSAVRCKDSLQYWRQWG